MGDNEATSGIEQGDMADWFLKAETDRALVMLFRLSLRSVQSWQPKTVDELLCGTRILASALYAAEALGSNPLAPSVFWSIDDMQFMKHDRASFTRLTGVLKAARILTISEPLSEHTEEELTEALNWIVGSPDTAEWLLYKLDVDVRLSAMSSFEALQNLVAQLEGSNPLNDSRGSGSIADDWKRTVHYISELGEFWHRWITNCLLGNRNDPDLIRDVLLIPEDDWSCGHDHIAEKITQIEAEHLARNLDFSESTSGELRQERYLSAAELRPDSVTNLFEHAQQVRATFSLSAMTLTERYGLFHKMACPNEIIPLFEPLRALPKSLARASNLLAQGQDGEEELKDEIAFLRGLIASLEKELVAAKAEIEDLKHKPWYKSAWVLGGGSVIGAVLSTAWLVSGDELGPQKRWNMLSEYWDFVFPDEAAAPVLQYELPDTWDV